MKRQSRAFTLIEILIIIAILSIISGSLIAVIVAPIKEQVVTDLRTEQLGGTTLFFSALTADIHDADSLVLAESGRAFHLGGERHIVYHVDGNAILRRTTDLSPGDAASLLDGTASDELLREGTPMLAMISELTVTPTEIDNLWSFSVTASVSRLHEDHRHTRVATLLLGATAPGRNQ